MKYCKNKCRREPWKETGFCLLCLQYFRKSNGTRGQGYVPFTQQVVLLEGHWIWTGVTTSQGYGLFLTPGGTVEMAHRASYEHYKKPIPRNRVIDHLCREPLCVYPNHLEPVTNEENRRRIGMPPMVRKYGRKVIEL